MYNQILISSKVDTLRRELRNTLVIWATFLTLLLVLCIQLTAQSSNKVSVPVVPNCPDDAQYRECLALYQNRDSTEVDTSDCSRNLLIFFYCYVGVIALKFVLACYDHGKVMGKRYHEMDEINDAIKAHQRV